MTARREVDLTDQQPVAGGLANRAERLPDLGAVSRVANVPLELRSSGSRAAPGRARAADRREALGPSSSRSIASMRKPSTPRSRQNRTTSRIASTHLGVAPVEVGLLGIEGVQVPAARCLVAGPGGAAERAETQLFGGPSTGDHTYQSGCSRNQGCSIEVCTRPGRAARAGRAVRLGHQGVEVRRACRTAGSIAAWSETS